MNKVDSDEEDADVYEDSCSSQLEGLANPNITDNTEQTEN